MSKKKSNLPRENSSRRNRKKQSAIETSSDLWESVPVKYRSLIVFIFLLIVPSFLFSEVYFGNQQFVAHDIQQFHAAARSVIEYQDETGEDALWATNIFSGMPSYIVIGNKTFSHVDSLLRNIFPAVFIPIIPFIICISGVFFLCRLMGCRPLPSALAALGICLTTYIPIIVGAGHNTKLIAYSWIPWVIAGYWMLSRSDKQIAGLFIFAMALNFTLRAEHVQVLYYFLFFLAIWFMYDGVVAFRTHILPDWSRRAALMVLAGLLALAANIQPFWSVYEYSSYSIRGGSELQDNTSDGGLDIDYAFAWSQGRSELLTLLIPDSFGGSSAEGTYWGPKTFTSGPHYLGAIIFLMFLVGLFNVPGRLKFVFLGAGILALLFSLGNNFLSFNNFFFQYMPLFNKFRTPEMWLIVTVFSFSLIATLGMNWIYESWKDGTITLSRLYVPGGLALAIALFFAVFAGSTFSFEKDGERRLLAQQVANQQNMDADNPQVQQYVSQYIDQQIKPLRKEKATSDSKRFLLFVLLGGGFLAATALGKIPANYTLAALVLLTAVDLVQVGNRYIYKSSLIPADIPAHQAVARKIRPVDRYIEDHMQEEHVWPWRTFPLGDGPFNNAVPAAYVYPSIGGYSGAKLSHYQNVIDEALFSGPAGINMPVLNMLNTRFLTNPTPLNIPGWNVAFQDDSGVVMENQNVLPKAWFVDSLVTVDEASRAMDELRRFDAAVTAILMASGNKPQITPTENRSVQISTYGPREIRADVTTDEPSFLVLSEIFYPAGWHARLNDEPVEIHRTNYILRGFEIPEGKHELTLRFDPRSHILGAKISFIFNWLLLLTGVYVLYQYYQERKKRKSSSDSIQS